MYKIYHNPRCQKSRAGLKYLEEKGYAFEIVKYFENALTMDELDNLLELLGKKPSEILRHQEEEYKMYIKGKNLTDNELKEFILKFPKLLKRPIVVHNQKAVWADPAIKIQSL